MSNFLLSKSICYLNPEMHWTSYSFFWVDLNLSSRRYLSKSIHDDGLNLIFSVRRSFEIQIHSSWLNCKWNEMKSINGKSVLRRIKRVINLKTDFFCTKGEMWHHFKMRHLLELYKKRFRCTYALPCTCA